VEGSIVGRESHFARGSRFSSERISNILYLKYEGNYISFSNNTPIIVEDIFNPDDLVYIEPYFNGIFHLKYRSSYIDLNIESLPMEGPIKLQWVTLNVSQANFELDAYIDTYDFLGPYQHDYISVDGFDLLNPTKSFFLIPEGDFRRQMVYDREEYLVNFAISDYNIAIRLIFAERDDDITVYSEDFGYFQLAFDEDNDKLETIFSHDYCECPIILEQARHFTTFYLKYSSSYIKLIHRDGVYYCILINEKYQASVFQAISSY
jgi:hypothetical protein